MIVRKTINDYGTFDIELQNNDVVLSICFQGQDHLILCRHIDYRPTRELDFEISKTQGELYRIFEKLYSSILTGNLLGLETSTEETTKLCALELNTDLYKSIVQDGVITIMCDNCPLTCPNILRIYKTENSIKLFFWSMDGKQERVPKLPYGITVGIRQSGSRIYNFCIPFNTLFKDLQKIEETKENEPNTLKPKTFINTPTNKNH